MSNQAVVFFATGYATWGMIAKQWRRPGVVWRGLLARLSRVILRSDISHCSIGTDLMVLDKQMSGSKLWRVSRYLDVYPTLSHAYVVPTPKPADIKNIHTGGKINPVSVIYKWVTRGRWETDDCVCLTRRVLRRAGVNVPKSAFTPERLDSWLSQQGYERIEL